MRDYYKGKDEAIRQVKQLYQSGLDSMAVAKQLGLHQQTVLRYIHMSKVPIRKPKRFWSPEKVQEAIRLYQTGLTLGEVAKRLGGKAATVALHLRNHGVSVRGKDYYSRGERNPAWKNGRRKTKGYIYLYAPDHPHRTSHNQVSEQRLVMEKKLGRYLLPTEVVDHINGITDDNRPENLRVFSSNAEHLHVTLQGHRPKWSAAGWAKLRSKKGPRQDRKPHGTRSPQISGASQLR